MTAQPGLPHKVSQIRHDLDDLYELMSKVQENQTHTEGILQSHGNRLGELQRTLDLHGSRLDRIESNQHQTDGRLDQVDSRLDRIESNQHQTDGRLDQVDSRLDRIEDNQRRQFEQLSAQLAEVLGMLRGPVAAAEPAPKSEQ